MATRTTTLALVLALAACTRGGGTQGDGRPEARIERADDPVPYQYLVVLKPGGGSVADVASDLLASQDAWVLRTYERALRGFAIHASEETARGLSRDPRVAWVAEDGRVKAQATAWQQAAPAGLDRVDQRWGTDGRYGYHDAAGEGVRAYVLDTGILSSHTEFAGRAPEQRDFVGDGGAGDCNGHGTHVAAILGGSTYGVAKRVSLHSLRVLGCDGAGTTSTLVAALDWLVANGQTPAVANLSLGRGPDAALDAAVAAVVARGIPVVVAAGDARRDACTTSPGRVAEALTVASSDLSGAEAAVFSNRGPCIDLFAPGVSIRSASIARTPGSTAYGESVLQSGTSVSAPFVAGTVALYLGRSPGASPENVARALFANSTRAPASPPRYTPDRLLFTAFVDDDNSADAAAPSVSLDAPPSGATVSGPAVEVTATATDDVGVTRVELFASGRFIASSEASPHSFTWDTRREPNGSGTLVVRAYDRAGHATDSAPVTVTVANDGVAHLDPALGVPRCETVAPACDSLDLLAGRADIGPEQNAPNTLASSCPTASDPTAVCVCADGPFGKYGVDESVQTYYHATDTVPPYEFAWSPRHGVYQLVARAFDGAGLAKDSAPVTVLVGDTTPPTCSVRVGSGVDPAHVVGSILLEADAADDTEVASVSFYRVGPPDELVGSSTTAPYSALWDSGPLLNGDYQLYCVAKDTSDLLSLDRPFLTLTVDDQAAPSVEIVSPALTYDPPGTLVPTPVSGATAIGARATDDGAVQKVEFFLDDSTIPFEVVHAAPYEFTWDSGTVANGSYALTARAHDYNGHSTTSAPVQITTGNVTPPSVSILFPLAGATLAGLVPVRAQVSQPGGRIVMLELLDGDTLVQSSTEPPGPLPYELLWTAEGATLGAHLLTVRATDLVGNVGTASVEVFVEPTAATHDAAYGAPVCATETSRCHSSLLLDGRGSLGPEANAPNNRGFPCPTPTDPAAVCQCADGDMGVYHQDESIDFISVSSRGGGTLTGGGLVDVEVRAWIFDAAQDRVDLFHAADATNPVWVPLPNVALTGDGPQTLRTSYVLPHGRRQAFRASVRFGPLEAGPCVPGDYNDHDDLVFAVASVADASPPTVAITAPAEGASVESLVTIAAVAGDDVAVASVSFLVDGVVIGTDYTAPYTWVWDVRGLGEGPRILTAVATDLAGNVTASTAVHVTVLDRVPPTVSLGAPMDRETVMGTVALAATADDAVGVTRVEFRVGGVLVATDATAPYSATWNSASRADGVTTVVARAFDAAGNFADSAPIAILVSNFGNASWSNALKAPACTTAASKCFTGTLVNGRGPLGPEPNAPNTLGASCADGTQGSYHVDESIDAVTVRSPTGTLAVGGTAIVEVKLWAGRAYGMDSLDLYFTADPSSASPVWTRFATLRPTRAGAQVLAASYVLPAGGLQAVRAQLRYAGAETIVCGGGTFDDRDDLVFAVVP